MKAIVLDDGKVTIPKELLDALGFRPGTVLEMQNQAGALVAWKESDGDKFEKWKGRGKLPPGAQNVDQYLGITRDGNSR